MVLLDKHSIVQRRILIFVALIDKGAMLQKTLNRLDSTAFDSFAERSMLRLAYVGISTEFREQHVDCSGIAVFASTRKSCPSMDVKGIDCGFDEARILLQVFQVGRQDILVVELAGNAQGSFEICFLY